MVDGSNTWRDVVLIGDGHFDVFFRRRNGIPKRGDLIILFFPAV